MLNHIEVNGFKSLQDFSLKIEKGVNIIVGPNGAGKTNIVSFFEFISDLVNDKVSEAVFKSGGVASVFHRNPDNSTSDIEFTLEGQSSVVDAFETGSLRRKTKYKYSCIISISSDNSIIYFKSQSLDFAIAGERGLYKKSKYGKLLWDISLESSTDFNMRSALSVKSLDLRKVRPQIYMPRGSDKDALIKALEQRTSRYDLSTTCIVQMLYSTFGRISAMKTDLSSGRAYNVYPRAVKSREDISTPVGVSSDGSGTSSTLFMLSKERNNTLKIQNYYRSILPSSARRINFRRNSFSRILDLIRLVNTSINDIDISLDPFDNYIRVNFVINTKEGPIHVPLQHMSDGTAKWLALMIAILTNQNMFAIEEPENFLHPFMQKEILNIIRNSTLSSRGDRFALITTHSETLLNAANPSEIIVVSMVNGKTNADRVANPKNIESVLAETGFGLGSLFVSGGLDND